MNDHCPACRIARELTEHRDTSYPVWGKGRAGMNFAVIIAQRACPDYTPAESGDGA